MLKPGDLGGSLDEAQLPVYIDGADEITESLAMVKGGGGAHTREKILAAAADSFVVIADSSKTVDRLRAPIPLELLAFGLPSTVQRLRDYATARGGFLQLEAGSKTLRAAVDPFGPGEVDLVRSLKARFDPRGTLNRGRWMEGV